MIPSWSPLGPMTRTRGDKISALRLTRLPWTIRDSLQPVKKMRPTTSRSWASAALYGPAKTGTSRAECKRLTFQLVQDRELARYRLGAIEIRKLPQVARR